MRRLEDIAEVQEMLSRLKTTVLLRPTRAEHDPGPGASKFGGEPNMIGEDTWPVCARCKTPFHFVLQFYRRDFSQFYWPGAANLYRLFRCPNDGCLPEGPEESQSDRALQWQYATTEDSSASLPIPQTPSEDEIEQPVPACALHPVEATDYPAYWDGKENWWGESFVRFDKRYRPSGEFDAFFEKYEGHAGSKIGGFPFWLQSPDFESLRCSCGRQKEFVFQLASHSRDSAEDHGVMIGDAGNIYFFVCRECGVHTMQTCWDCY